MSVFDNYTCCKQMTIFDFPECLPEGKDRRRAELKQKWGNENFSPAEQNYIDTGKTDFWKSKDVPLGDKLRADGWKNVYDEEPAELGEYELYCIQNGRTYVEEYKGNHTWTATKCGYDLRWWRPKRKKVCKYSKHTCNKEVLWEVAQNLDNIKCQKVCCRQCSVSGCGARCNGSEELNRETLLVDVRGFMDDGYCPKCNRELDDLVEECPECHSRLDWSRWKIVNET